MRRTFPLLALVFAAILALGVNLLAARLLPQARIDLTAQRLYTLAPGTRQVLAGLAEPLTLRLFYSRRLGAELPQYGAYAERVRDLLREYVTASRGKLRLELLDPEPFSEAEDRAVARGLQGVPLDQGGEQVFFGLVASNARDEERLVPFFQPERERFLEADITRILYELSHPTRPVLGLMTALPLAGDPRALMLRQPALAQPQVILRQLRESFEVRDVALDATAIPPEVQVLLLAHPQNLPEPAQYAVDQFVLRGGKLILLLDPHSEMQAGRAGAAGGPTASSLDRLLRNWGVEAPADRVVADLRGAWRVRTRPGERVQAVDYLAWFNLGGDSLNRAELATSQLETVSVASAGTLRRREGAATEWTPLLTSSAQSMLIDAARVRGEPDPVRILAGFRADGERHVIGARLRGTFATAFPEGPPAPAEGLPAHIAQGAGPSNLVIIHDTDLLEDRFWVRVQDFAGQPVATPFSGNGAFLVNLAEQFAGSDAMISLRSRGESQRPFDMVEDIRRQADAQFRASEQALTERLQATEARLRTLRQGGTTGQAVVTPEGRAEIEAAREQIAATRRELRAVQLELRRDIEALETRLRLLNIVAVPLVLTVLAIVIAVMRTRRRSAARA